MQEKQINPVERTIEWLLYNSRWLLAPIYLGMGVILLVFTITFVYETYHLATRLFTIGEIDLILTTLTLIDLVLVASLIVMVMVSGYENFVSRIDIRDGDDRLSWIGKLDAGTLKLKVSASIVAISSIHLLKAFMNVKNIDNSKLIWLVAIHITFVISALLMGVLEKHILDKEGNDRH